MDSPAYHPFGVNARCKGVCGECGWGRFIVVCFLYETNPNPRKQVSVGKSAKMPRLTLFFLGWVGLGLGSASFS